MAAQPEACEEKRPSAPPATARGIKRFAGLVAGGVAAPLVCMPLDVMRTKMQASDGLILPRETRTLRGLTSALQRDIALKGSLPALFTGLSPAVLGSTLQYLTLMGLYRPLREHFQAAAPSSSHLPEVAASMVAGAASCVVTNPAWVIKTRMQTASPNAAAPVGAMASAAALVRAEGSGALFRGVMPSLLLVPHNMVFLPLHDELRRRDYATLPAVFASTAAAGLATYPLQTIRTRFQAERAGEAGHREYASFAAVFKHARRAEGGLLRGLYAGFWPHLAKSVLGWSIKMSVAERVEAALNAR